VIGPHHNFTATAIARNWASSAMNDAAPPSVQRTVGAIMKQGIRA